MPDIVSSSSPKNTKQYDRAMSATTTKVSSTSLLDRLSPHWQNFQKRVNDQNKDIGERRTLTKIQQEIDKHYHRQQGACNNSDNSEEPDTATDELPSVLQHFLDCAIAAVLETGTTITEVNEENETDDIAIPGSTCKETVDRILDLTAAVAVHTGGVRVCNVLLQRSSQFSTVIVSESVRAAACQFIGYLVKNILNRGRENKKTVGSYNDTLDSASQTLLPRFTDKSQLVRLAAVQAGAHFFSGDANDPDILQAMIWSLQHDPSVANRAMACQVIPLNLETVDYVLSRVRDVKAKVRCEALGRFHMALASELLEPPQAAAAVVAGYTKRCSATKKAAERMICIGWMKSFHYKPMELLQRLSVYENEAACEIVIKALCDAVECCDMLKEDLTENEIRAFQEGMKKFTSNVSIALDVNNDIFLNAEVLFSVNSIMKSSQDAKYKEELLSELFPDIPTLCCVLERHATALVRFIQQKDERNEMELTFLCLQLLRLACYQQSSTMEEGSRRVFCAAMKSMLANILTPDDLVEGCVESLRHFEKDSSNTSCFVQQISSIVQELREKSAENPEFTLNCTVRILSILSVALEHITHVEALTSKDSLEEFSQYILPCIDNDKEGYNSLVQELSVSCLGKLGLLSDKASVQNKYYPALMELIQDDAVAIAIRAQALLALGDFSILLKTDDPKFHEIAAKLMKHPNQAVVCIAAEVCAKLLFAGRVDESISSNLLAQLVFLFFEQADYRYDSSEEGDPSERGSPIRLQQLLSMFFPTLCIRSQEGQDALMGAIEPLLDLVINNNSGSSGVTKQRATRTRKGTSSNVRTKQLPIAKMIEFICSNVQIGEMTLKANQDKVATEKNGNDEPESSPSLIAAIQVAGFLSKNVETVNTTTLRSLCKLIGDIHLDVDKEACEHLSMLKELMEDLGMVLEDETCIKYLKHLNEILEELEIIDVDDDGSETSSMIDENVLVNSQKAEKDFSIVVDGDENNHSYGNFGLMVTPTNTKANESKRMKKISTRS